MITIKTNLIAAIAKWAVCDPKYNFVMFRSGRIVATDGVRHGMCFGADAEFHSFVHDEGFFVVGHPSDIAEMTADLVIEGRHPHKPPLDRNRDIVTESRAMIAAPYEAQEQARGGTWSTIRETRRQGKPLALCLPDGTIVFERIHGLWS